MKKNIFILIIIFSLLLAACDKADLKTSKVEALVTKINVENESLIVEGIGKNNPLGDSSIIDAKGAEIKRLEKTVDFSDIKIGDKLILEVGEIAESYPTQAVSKKIKILEKEQADLESERKEIGKVFIKESSDKISIYSEGLNISQLSLVALEYHKDKDILIEKEILKKKTDIKIGEKTIWEVIYSEGIPSMKLIWELSNGDMGEYLISYNGRYGRNPDKTIIYYSNGDTKVEYEKMEEEVIDKEEKSESKNIKLYFILFDEKDAYLVEETHEIENVSGIARLTLETLRDVRPKTDKAMNPIYKSTKINNIYIEDKIIIVDFSQDIKRSNFGSTGEALQVQAIVNTLTQFPTVEGVIFKVEGNEDIEGWLSHIGNVDHPFREDMSMVK